MLFAFAWLDPARLIADSTPVPASHHIDITDGFLDGWAVLAPPGIPRAVTERYGPEILHQPVGNERATILANVLAEQFTPQPVTYLKLAEPGIPRRLRALLSADPNALVVLRWTDPNAHLHPQFLLGYLPVVTFKARLVPPL